MLRNLLESNVQRDTFSNRNYTKEGAIVSCEWYNSALRDTTGRLTSLLSLVLNVTEREQTATALRESESRYRALVEQAADAIWTVDQHGNFLTVNSRACEMLGYTQAELLQLNTSDLIPAEDLTTNPIPWEEIRTGKIVQRKRRLRRKDGTIFPVETCAKKIESGVIQTIIRDITERQQAEEKLRNSEKYFRALSEKSVEVVSLFGADGTVLYVSPSAMQVVGYSPEELVGTNAYEFVHPDRREFAKAFVAELLRSPGGSATITERLRHKDGSWRWVESTWTNLLTEPSVQAIVANSRDITERRRVEEAIKHSQANLEEAQAQAHLGSWELDPVTERIFWSAEMFRLYERDPALGPPSAQEFFTLVHPEDRQRLIELYARILRSGEPWSAEFRTNPERGPLRVFTTTFHCKKDDRGQVVRLAGTNLDITKLKLSEEALLTSERNRTAELLSLAHSLSAEMPLEVRLQDLCRRTVELIGCDRSSVFLREGAYYRAKYNYGNPPDIAALFPQHTVRLQDPLTVRAVETRDCVIVNDALYSPLMNVRTAQLARIQAIAIASFHDEAGEPLGFITAEYNENPGTFTELTSSLVLELAKAVEMAIVADQQGRERQRTEEALRQAEAKYRDIFENATEGIFQTSLEGRFLTANPALARMLGYESPAELMASLTDVARQLYVELARRTEIQQLLAEHGVVRNFEAQFYRKDRSVGWYSVSARAVRDASGTLLYYEGTVEDITARKQAETVSRQEAQVSAALARVGQELISSLNAPTILERLCQLITEVLDCDQSSTILWQPQDRVYVPVASYGHLSEQVEVLRTLQIPPQAVAWLTARLEEQDVVEVETATAPDPLVGFWLRQVGTTAVLYIALRRSGQFIGVQTAAYRGRTGFSTIQQRIAQGITQLASFALNNVQLFAQIESTSRLKSDFLATVSHELRTPLNIVIGYTDLLLEETFGPVSPEQANSLQRVRKAALEERELINAMLDVSRLEASGTLVERREVDVTELLAELQQETAKDVREKPGLSVEWQVAPGLPPLWTDQRKLKIVLKNLIGNAVKFTDAGCVTTAVAARAGGVEFRITDTGIGIRPEVQQVMFEMFQQGDSSATRPYEGVGLGLYIVQRMLELLGGTVTVESEAVKGSTFRVWVPSRVGVR